MNYCSTCFEKQKEIDQLKGEIDRLKSKIHRQERNAKEGYFGSCTPSSKKPLKKNASEDNEKKQGGAKLGHPGHGRCPLPAEEITNEERIIVSDRCPHCDGEMALKGLRDRNVIDCVPVKIQKKHIQLEKKQCKNCGRIVEAKAPGVLPKFLYGNQLMTHIAIQHYLYGQTLGQIEKQTGLPYSGIVSALHNIASRLEPAMQNLIQEYRQASVKHADESTWRTDGKNGYAWLFATTKLSIFLFRNTRSASVVKEIFGDRQLPGNLVVDRYAAYNYALCDKQYCYSHLIRDVEDLEEEFPENQEIRDFCATFLPLLSAAEKLRKIEQNKKNFLIQAEKIKKKIIKVVHSSAKHPAIQNIQNLFREKSNCMYQWAKDPSIPADNNLAERDLRPLVVARKISFGSQSPKGAKTREVLMSIIHTLKKQTTQVSQSFKSALDHLAFDPTADTFKLLFKNNST